MTFFLTTAGFLAGFVDSIAGGGGLISLPALLVAGVSPVMALGTNKVVGMATTLASSFRYRAAGISSWRELRELFAASFVCSALGAFLASRIRPDILRPLILALLVLAGAFVFIRNRFGMEERRETRRPRWLAILLPAVGFYDGFFGPGAGTFMMMIFVLLGGETLLPASAKSRILNLASCLGALLFFGSTGHVDLRTAIAPAAASFVGGVLGAQLAIDRGVRIIRPIFLAVTWGLIAKVAWDLFRP